MVGLHSSWLAIFFFVVNWNRIQVFCFKDLIAIKATYVIHAVSPVKEFGSLVLTTWHSEIFPILVSTGWVSSPVGLFWMPSECLQCGRNLRAFSR
jgi:hypothetical protein